MSAASQLDRLERVKAVVLLLANRNGYLDSAQRLAQSFPSKPGPAPGNEVACGCGTLRTVLRRDKMVVEWFAGSKFCPLCRGTGFRSRLRKLDGEATHDERGALFDPYVFGHDRSEKAGKTQTSLRCLTSTETDHELARLRRDERARAGVSTGEAYAWERARARRDRSGSFRELNMALEALHIKSPLVRALLDNIFSGEVYGPAGTIQDNRYTGRIPKGSGDAFWEALYFLEVRMPEPIRLPQALVDTQAFKARSASVDELAQRGWTPRQISRELQMDLRKVKAVLRNQIQSTVASDALTSVTTTRQNIRPYAP